jgi:hypothetical protein
MKKELLAATALVTTLGVTSIAQAASGSFSGSVKAGVEGEDSDSGADGTFKADGPKSNLSFSASETTDGGVKISTGFTVVNEGSTSNNASGLTLTFTDGSVLDLIKAGNAYKSQLATVPGAGGEQGISGTTGNHAPTGLAFANASSNVGFEYHSVADAFGIDGFKWGLSGSTGDDSDGTGSSSTVESAYSVGVSYVSDAGDTTVTVGGGFVSADDSNSTTANSKGQESAVAISAVTGDLTVGAGWASGTEVATHTTVGQNSEVDGAEVITAGAKYVSGDITFTVSYADGEAKDTATFGSAGTKTDTYTKTAASVAYAVASGVTATIGYSNEERSDEGTDIKSTSGSSWYIGATVSF